MPCSLGSAGLLRILLSKLRLIARFIASRDARRGAELFARGSGGRAKQYRFLLVGCFFFFSFFLIIACTRIAELKIDKNAGYLALVVFDSALLI